MGTSETIRSCYADCVPDIMHARIAEAHHLRSKVGLQAAYTNASVVRLLRVASVSATELCPLSKICTPVSGHAARDSCL